MCRISRTGGLRSVQQVNARGPCASGLFGGPLQLPAILRCGQARAVLCTTIRIFCARASRPEHSIMVSPGLPLPLGLLSSTAGPRGPFHSFLSDAGWEVEKQPSSSTLAFENARATRGHVNVQAFTSRPHPRPPLVALAGCRLGPPTLPTPFPPRHHTFYCLAVRAEIPRVHPKQENRID